MTVEPNVARDLKYVYKTVELEPLNLTDLSSGFEWANAL